MGLFSSSWHHLPTACFISSLFKKFFLAYPRISLNLPAEIQLFLHQYTICLKVLCAYFLFSCFMLLFFCSFITYRIFARSCNFLEVFWRKLLFFVLFSFFPFILLTLQISIWLIFKPDVILTGFVLPHEEKL